MCLTPMVSLACHAMLPQASLPALHVGLQHQRDWEPSHCVGTFCALGIYLPLERMSTHVLSANNNVLHHQSFPFHMQHGIIASCAN